MKLNAIIKSILMENTDTGEIDQRIMAERPNTIPKLEAMLKSYGVSYKIQKIRYLGYPQGVKVIIKTPEGKTKTLPGNGLVYSVFGWE